MKECSKAKWNTYSYKREKRSLHARNRALERYGLNLVDYDLEQIVRRIKQEEATFQWGDLKGKSVWEVEVCWGIVCRIVYDARRMEVVTFLPMALEPGISWEEWV